MSSAAQSFYQKIQTDPSLQAELQNIQAANPDGGDAAIKGLIALAKKQGFKVTEADMKSFIKSEAEAQSKSGAELSDDQLEAVAGGKGVNIRLCGCQWPFKSSQFKMTV